MYKIFIVLLMFLFGCKSQSYKLDNIDLVYYYEIQHGDHLDTLDLNSYISNYDTSWSKIKEIPILKACKY